MGQSVLLIEEVDETVGELVVDVEELTAEGQHVNAVFEIEIRDSEIVDVAYRPAENENVWKETARRPSAM